MNPPRFVALAIALQDSIKPHIVIPHLLTELGGLFVHFSSLVFVVNFLLSFLLVNVCLICLIFTSVFSDVFTSVFYDML